MSNPPDQQSTPTLREFVERKIDARLAGLRQSLPAEVIAYDPKSGTVTAQALIDPAHVDEAGVRRSERLPVVTDVPVVFFGGAGTRDSFPLDRGDIVLLIVASSSIARWKVTGKGGDPGDDRHHRLSDAMALPFSRGKTHESARVIEGDDIRLGGEGASLAVTRTSDVQAALVGALSDGTVVDAIFTYGSTPPGPGKAAALVVLTAAVNAHFASSPVGGAAKVKAE